MKVVDLFSGCGGFAFGAHSVGYSVPAAFDVDPVLTSSYKLNYPDTRLVLKDVRSVSAPEVESAAGGRIDGLIGGPPCQGFSSIGLRNRSDPRRKLLGEFFRLVEELRPKFFVMENVAALVNKSELPGLEAEIDQVRHIYRVHGPTVLNACDFGAATNRRRVFVIGVRKDLGFEVTEQDLTEERVAPGTVSDAIRDLADASFLGVHDGFDVWKLRAAFVSRYAGLMRSRSEIITGHRAASHTTEVAERFSNVRPGATDSVGRHPRLVWEGQCPTLRAGTGQDRGSFQAVRPIHPEEDRVITVREAARLQGFPDCFRFHPTTWHSFRMIGNSVSPFQSMAIFRALKKKFK